MDTQGNHHDFSDPERLIDPDSRELSEEAAWSRRTFDSLRVGGVWGVPRSGLVFTKTSEETLALTERLDVTVDRPDTGTYGAGIPMVAVYNPSREAQDDDYAAIAEYMTEAGITVTDETSEEE